MLQSSASFTASVMTAATLSGAGGTPVQRKRTRKGGSQRGWGARRGEDLTGDSHLKEIPPYNMLFFHGRLSQAGAGYAMRHSRLHCYIGDRRVERVLTPKFLDQSDLKDRNASLSWFHNDE
eukprot:COSAG05_NODE_12822_length_453_cov_0.635593_2_plen_120_part_01